MLIAVKLLIIAVKKKFLWIFAGIHGHSRSKKNGS